jgi:hypothetical protein
MFCPFCQVARVENEAPCPNCGAASPLLGRSQANGWQAAGPGPTATAWGGPVSASSQQWSPIPQTPLSFDSPSSARSQNGGRQPDQQDQQQYWSHAPDPAPQNQQAQGQFWSHVSGPLDAPAPQQYSPRTPGQAEAARSTRPQAQQPPWQTGVGIQEASPSQQQQAQSEQRMLPALYQGGATQLQPGIANLTQQLIPVQNIEHLLPAMPAEEEAVYVPPMYTEPRPLIPRYRIISGFLSIIIVSLLVCTGAGYYAKASGTLTNIQHVMGISTPPNLKPTAQAQIPDPPDKVDEGPAKGVITAAATTARVGPNNIAVAPQNIFAVSKPIYVTFSVAAQKKQGQVIVKWYMNDHLLAQRPPLTVAANKSINGFTDEEFAIPAPGKVELYWNNQLARTLYFAVK